jgi:xylan 1,4-beta-xylosidase
MKRLFVLLLAGACIAAAAGAGVAQDRAEAGAGAPPAARYKVIRVQADKALGEAYDFWSVGNFNRPSLLTDSNTPRHLSQECPLVKELNLVYLLGGRYRDENAWFQGVGPDGNIRADFSGMIAQLKACFALGFTPRVVLDNVPYNMSAKPQENVYGNTAPPKDEKVWGAYVRAAIEAMVQAFGRQKVAKWPFRVGTEPDLRPGHWAGTKEQWLAHYDYTVDAVTAVLPEAKIGPGNILNPTPPRDPNRVRRWGLDIIDHCAEGLNACTGGKGARMDHFSCSWYTRVGGSPRDLDAAIGAIRGRLLRYPQFAALPIEVGEFSVLGDDQGHHIFANDTTEWSASFYAGLADRVYALNVQRVYEWDHATLGVPHPRMHVIEMLSRMAGGRRLEVVSPGGTSLPASAASGPAAIAAASAPASAPAWGEVSCGAVAVAKDGSLFVLLYNHNAARAPGPAQNVRLEIAGTQFRAGQAWRLSEWSIDANRTVWAYANYADAQAAGLPALPLAGLYEGSPRRFFGRLGPALFQKNIEKYRKLSELPQTRRDEPVTSADGRLTVEVVLPAHSVRFLEFRP